MIEISNFDCSDSKVTNKDSLLSDKTDEESEVSVDSFLSLVSQLLMMQLSQDTGTKSAPEESSGGEESVVNTKQNQPLPQADAEIETDAQEGEIKVEYANEGGVMAWLEATSKSVQEGSESLLEQSQVPLKLETISSNERSYQKIPSIDEDKPIDTDNLLVDVDVTNERIPVPSLDEYKPLTVTSTSVEVKQDSEPPLDLAMTHNPMVQVNEVKTSTTKPINHLDIPVHIGKVEWMNQFSQHIEWLGHQQIKTAVIKINPEELGPLEITLKVDKQDIQLQIVSHNNQIRDMLDQSMPRLKDLLADQGVNLSQASVDSGRREANPQEEGGVLTASKTGHLVNDDKLSEPMKIRISKGLVDYFA